MGGGWESCGKDLEALGTLWAVLRGLFFMLVFGVVFKSALGGLWAGFWVDFKGSGTDFGRVLASCWEVISRVLAGSGLLWAILNSSCLLLLAFARFCLLLLAFAGFGPILLAFACQDHPKTSQ